VEILDSTITTAASTTSSIEDEVLGTEVLPFTGVDNDLLALLAGSLAMLGSLVLIASRRVED
jgi:LPXTG-motif cell wall-anchored protein